jgi:hypothetical protein
MIFLVSVPIWLWLLLYICTAPGRARARRNAAHMQELQVVSAMTEGMKAEYWARKHAEAEAYRVAHPPMTTASYIKAAVILSIMGAVIAYGIMGGNG